jgi:hypothetical protein
MKAIATSLFAALALAGGVAHADPSTFGDPDNVPFQGVYAPSAVVSATPGPLTGSELAGFIIGSGPNDSAGSGLTILVTGDGSDDGGQTLLAGGSDSDDAGQTLLADGGGSDDNGPILFATGSDDGSTQLA